MGATICSSSSGLKSGLSVVPGVPVAGGAAFCACTRNDNVPDHSKSVIDRRNNRDARRMIASPGTGSEYYAKRETRLNVEITEPAARLAHCVTTATMGSSQR